MSFGFSAVRRWGASAYQGAATAVAVMTNGAATVVSRTRGIAYDTILGITETGLQSLQRRSNEEIKTEHLEPIKLNDLQLKAVALLEEIWSIENLPAQITLAAENRENSPLYAAIKIKLQELLAEINQCEAADKANDPKSKKYDGLCRSLTSMPANMYGLKCLKEDCCSIIHHYFTKKKEESPCSELSSKILRFSILIDHATNDAQGKESMHKFNPTLTDKDRQELNALLLQLKILYPKDLLTLPFRDRVLKDDLFKKTTNASFQLLMSLIKDIHDSYADFVIFDILNSKFNEAQKMELLDLALGNQVVCSSLYRNGVAWIDNLSSHFSTSQPYLTRQVLEKFCFLGFDIQGKGVKGEGFVNVCRHPIFKRDYLSIIGSSMDIERLFTVKDRDEGRADIETYSKRGREIPSYLSLIQHSMFRSQTLEELRREEEAEENQQRMNPLMVVVGSAMQSQELAMPPVSVLRLIAGFNGYIYHYETIAARIVQLGGNPILTAAGTAKAASAAAGAAASIDHGKAAGVSEDRGGVAAT